MSNFLYVIPARGGSKGIPGKNIKEIAGQPLICHSIDIARNFVSDDDICVTTDSDKIISVVESHGLKVNFKRPDYLATDTASSYDVLIHALDYYELQLNRKYEWMVLFQPTTPFRKVIDVKNMLDMVRDDIDMVVSVKKATTNPYYNCYDEGSDGYLKKFIESNQVITGRQSKVPAVFEKNGSVYVIKTDSLRKQKMNEFKKVLFYEMEEVYSIDLDEPLDWIFAEAVYNHKLAQNG